MGTCVLEARTIHVPDLEVAAAQFPRTRQMALKQGYRSAIFAPLLRGDGAALGTIGVFRRVTGGFSEKDVALLETFADQAVIAIENVRLFNETKEALASQSASADVLHVISNSPTDVQPVFDAIVCTAVAADRLRSRRPAAQRRHALLSGRQRVGRRPRGDAGAERVAIADDTSLAGRVMLSKQPLHLADWSQGRFPISTGTFRALPASSRRCTCRCCAKASAWA